MLEGTNVALGITGSVAAVRVVELAHELRRQGASVRAIMTESARSIIHPWAVEFATETPVVTEITGAVEHVEIAGEDGWADVLVIAPATANTVGKIAAAIDDTPVTTTATTALGAGLPVVIAPAMHEPMYDHPGVLEAIDTVESWGVDFVDPRVEEGKAKIATDEAIVLDTARAVGSSPLDGTQIVVTSGATAEFVDPIRVLTNRASGKTGRAIAKATYALGADVVLVHDGPTVPYASVRQVTTAEEMHDAVMEAVEDADALVSAAAISDYTVEEASSKLRSGQDLTLDLEPTPKLIDTVRGAHPDLPIVGFKAETDSEERMIDAAHDLRSRVGLTFVIANDASVMRSDETTATLVAEDEERSFEGTKQELGDLVARRLADDLST